jgi:hypothetical protein
MRDLKNFTITEWIRLHPLVHAFKQTRNDIWQNAYLKARPRELDNFLENTSHLKGKNIANIVAFSQPWVLDFSLKMAARHLQDATVLVFDNSRELSDRADIARVCRERGALHLALPPNSTRHANRSHGNAMTWIFHNVTRHIQPAVVGFLDHDMIPIEPVQLAERIGTQPFYGRAIVSQWAWSLWAGYSLYNFPAVKDLPLNFLYDFSRGLDTGGRNWNCLYSKYSRDQLRFAEFDRHNFVDAEANILRKLRFVDKRWIHLGGVGYGENFRQNQGFFTRIADLVETGANCQRLLEALMPPR